MMRSSYFTAISFLCSFSGRPELIYISLSIRLIIIDFVIACWNTPPMRCASYFVKRDEFDDITTLSLAEKGRLNDGFIGYPGQRLNVIGHDTESVAAAGLLKHTGAPRSGHFQQPPVAGHSRQQYYFLRPEHITLVNSKLPPPSIFLKPYNIMGYHAAAPCRHQRR